MARGVTENRLCFLDALRVSATCAVVLLHVIKGVSDNMDMTPWPFEQTVFLLLGNFVTWCVPVFIVISGFLFLDPRRRVSFWQMLQKYCRRILLALVLFGIPYALAELVVEEHGFRFDMLGESVVRVCRGQSWSHMWYLYLILLLYLITPALKMALEKCPRRLLYATLAGIFAGSSILPFVKEWRGLEGLPSLPGACIYLFYYLWGYLSVTGSRRKNTGVMAAMTVVTAICMAAVGLTGDGRGQFAYNHPFTVCFSLLLFELAGMSEDFWRKREHFLKRAGELCFTVYLVHPVFVNFSYKFLHITPLGFPIGVSLPAFFAVIMALSVVTAWMLCRIPLLKRYVL